MLAPRDQENAWSSLKPGPRAFSDVTKRLSCKEEGASSIQDKE
jgi:hypothetical protein